MQCLSNKSSDNAEAQAAHAQHQQFDVQPLTGKRSDQAMAHTTHVQNQQPDAQHLPRQWHQRQSSKAAKAKAACAKEKQLDVQHLGSKSGGQAVAQAAQVGNIR